MGPAGPGWRAAFLAGVAVGLAAIPVVAQTRASPAAWTALESAAATRDHPLAGAIWSPGEARFLAESELHARLAAADVVILGEVHDNPEHHRLQAEFVENLIARGRKPTIVFEMIPQDLQARLDAHLRENPGDAAGLGAALSWEERGWPDWAHYRPIAEAALKHGLRIAAGDLPEDMRRTIGREGAGRLSADERARLSLDAALPVVAEESLRETLADSHCGLLPEASLDPMILVQRARDGALADAVARAAPSGPVVLIAGAGHARRDWGVPVPLAGRLPGANIVSLAFVEAGPGATDPAAHLPEAAGGGAAFDFVVFTPEAGREDSCAELRQRIDPSASQSGAERD